MARVRATPSQVVRHDLLAAHAPGLARGAAHRAALDAQAARRLLGEICDAPERYWQIALVPLWPQLRLVLEADTTLPSPPARDRGSTPPVRGHDPNLRWNDGVLGITEMVGRYTVAAAGRGPPLMPSIFAIKPVPPPGHDSVSDLGWRESPVIDWSRNMPRA